MPKTLVDKPVAAVTPTSGLEKTAWTIG